MLMIFYTLFLMIFSIMLVFSTNIKKAKATLIGGFLIYLPLYGRVLGWW